MTTTPPTPPHAAFAPRLLAWFDRHGRHDLPWQHPRSAYRVWIAEVMLQQTQVAVVKPYFERFMQAFPTLPALAAAPPDAVLAHWSGLGYYSRARNLHRAAQRCVAQHDGALPQDFAALADLPGIGRSTAAAILAQAHGQRHAILDGNVKRVLARVYGIEGWPGEGAVQKQLWALSEALLPDTRLADFTQAIMDLGATVCSRSRPACTQCPFSDACVANALGRTRELPAPRPRRERPSRDVVMLVLRDAQGRCLLERRPDHGLWSGLWSLPEFASAADARRGATALGAAARARALDAIGHDFTHFHLQIQPLLLDLPDAVTTTSSDRQAWWPLAALADLGLPAPVRRLLHALPPAPPDPSAA